MKLIQSIAFAHVLLYCLNKIILHYNNLISSI